MTKFNSPWIRSYPSWPILKEDYYGEVAIVGAGISGIVTLYFLLTKTQKQVALFEKGTVASGATGNNAGIAVAAAERPVTELIQEYGFEKTKQMFLEMDQAWDDLLEIGNLLGLKDHLIPIPHATFGLSSLESLLPFVEGDLIQKDFGRAKWTFFVKDDDKIRDLVPERLRRYIEYVPHSQILEILKTTDVSYIAAAVRKNPFKGGRINTFEFCHKILEYLKKTYPERFAVFEQTKINEISLSSSQVVLKSATNTIFAQELILCTNGYTDFRIKNEYGKNIVNLWNALQRKEGFLGAFYEDVQNIYAAAFFNDTGIYEDVPYWYISHVPLPTDNSKALTLVGGPEYDIQNGYPDEITENNAKKSYEVTLKFLEHTFNKHPKMDYFWGGIMGYTNDGLRWVGRDPEHSRLWYNLGCNGIGVLPGVAGAKKIARMMAGEAFESSILDPRS